MAWTDDDWNDLLLSADLKQCTPFIGAGAAAHILPTGRRLAHDWANEVRYPFPDNENLVRVAQFCAVMRGAQWPRNRIIRDFTRPQPPDYSRSDEPHSAIARLALPLYITTNYDDFMFKALTRLAPKVRPIREVCRWYQVGQRRRPKRAKLQSELSTEEPVVYHLHGTLDVAESMVVTEDDYLEFLMHVSEDDEIIPTPIQEKLSSSSLLFLGYSMEDMNFKVLLRRLATYMHRSEGARHVAVQIAPRARGERPTKQEIHQAERQQEYLEEHFVYQKVKVYWGTCQKFAEELNERWTKYIEEKANEPRG